MDRVAIKGDKRRRRCLATTSSLKNGVISSTTASAAVTKKQTKKTLTSSLSSAVPELAEARDEEMFVDWEFNSLETQHKEQPRYMRTFTKEMQALKSEEMKCRENGETAKERMLRQRRQEIDELNGLERAMDEYSKMKNVLYDMGKASSFKAEQQLLVSWFTPLSKRIAEEQKRCQKRRKTPLTSRLLKMNADKLAIITIHKVVNLIVPSAAGSAPFLDIANGIGQAVNMELHIDRLRKHKEVWDALQRSTKSELETGNRRALRRANNFAKLVLAGGDIESPSSSIMDGGGEIEDSNGEWSKKFCIEFGGWLLKMMIEEARLPSNIDAILAASSKERGAAVDEDGHDEEKTSSLTSPPESNDVNTDDESSTPPRVPHSDLPAAFKHARKLRNRTTDASSSRRQLNPQQHPNGVVQMDPALIKKLDTQHLLTSIYHPTFKPLLVPPRKWHAKPATTKRSTGQVVGGPSDGGYLLLRSQFMRTHGSKLQNALLTKADLTDVYGALNVLGSTPWKINERVLDVVHEKWNAGGGVAALPRRTDYDVQDVSWPDLPSPSSESGATSNEEMEAYEKLREDALKRYRYAKKLRQHNSDLHSLRCDTTLKLNQAEELRGEREFYFPFNVDFRGRVYPIPAHLNHMGNDLCRGILSFAESRPLGERGLRWLKIQLANLYGEDKCSFDERVAFVDANIEHVLESARRPNEYDWWLDADKPWQALATCHEVADAFAYARREGDDQASGFLSSLPVHQDGSCNGLQHYAALGRDRRGGAEVNLVSRDRPADVYSGVLDIVKEKVEVHLRGEDGADETEVVGTDGMTQQEVAGIVYDHLKRKTIKQTVMTTVYGVTFVGAKKQIYSQLRHLTEPGAELEHLGDDVIYGASGYLAMLTLSSQGELFASANRVKSWLRQVAVEVARCGQPISWMTPMGLPVVQPYRHAKKHRVKTHMQEVTVVRDDDQLPVSKPRQKSAFPPNFVHSLDSTHMMMTALECEKRDIEYTAVHDSYWTHACTVDELNNVLRDQFVELHSQPLLEELHESLTIRYPDAQFDDVPEPGSLDLDEVKSSEYFFN